MTQETVVLIKRIFGILLSISIIISGICLIAGCFSIYDSADHAYSRQAVADAFSRISIPVYICIALTITGFILDIILPKYVKKVKNTIPEQSLLKILSARKNINSANADITDKVLKERSRRKIVNYTTASIVFVICVVFLIYALNQNNFDADINGSVIKALRVLFPCVATAFAALIFAHYYCKRSMKREIDLLKQLSDKTQKEENKCKNRNALFIAKVSVLAIGIVSAVIGFVMGGTSDVLTKAINICTECIGLG